MQKNWVVLPDPPSSFFQEFPDLPPIVARLLYHRHLRTQKAIDEFLHPDYGEDIHDPFLFREMDKAVTRIFAAMAQKEKITIHGDYDADGVSAAVILTSLFQALEYPYTDVFLPHRETDGYGLNMNTVRLLHEANTKLIITCDCGISNTAEVNLARELGMDVIITDHHSIPAEVPHAYAIIHPKIPGETYPDQTLAGGGVAFKLMQALLERHAETHDRLPNGEKHEGFAKWQLDMAAIASVADMVPLLGESRTLTKYGLIVLNKTRRIGLQKLLLEARLMQEDGTKKKAIAADTIGFQIAPRVNAAGRMNHANVAYKLLATNDPIEAVDLAYELDQNNQERQKRTEELYTLAQEQLARESTDTPVLFVVGNGWPIGLVGLLAGKLKEAYQKPSIVMTMNQKEISGSGRSITGFNLIESLQEIPEQFLKFGGHPMACGFTLASKEHVESFKTALIQKYHERTTGKDIDPTLDIDVQVDLDDITWELYDLLDQFAPFGQANPKPRYMANGLKVVGLEPVGQDGKHLRIMVTHHSPRVRKTIGWRLCNGNGKGVNWGKELKIGDTIDMVFEVDVNEWNGNRELQLTIVDLKKCPHSE